MPFGQKYPGGGKITMTNTKKETSNYSDPGSMQLLGDIMDFGVALTENGAETWRTEDSLYRLASAYGFTNCNFWVVPSNIQATVTTPSGECITQIRSIKKSGIDFDKLEKLNALSRDACKNIIKETDLKTRMLDIIQTKPGKAWVQYLAGFLGGVGFGFFFHCDLQDAIVAAAASLLITFLSRRLRKRERNPLILNFFISFFAELLIILAVLAGIGHHAGYITIGVVMLLISALGATNGVRDMVHLDTLSGIMKLTESLTGAVGIVLGIGLPLFLFHFTESNEILTDSPVWWIQIISCTVGSIGFAFWFRVRSRKIMFCAFGAMLTWSACLVFRAATDSLFISIILATMVCAIYAQIIARVLKAPVTIFQTVSIFPLIPGSALYYLMYGSLLRDRELAFSKGLELVITCAGIVLGLMAVEVIVKNIVAGKAAKQDSGLK